MKTGYSLYRTFDTATDKEFRHLRTQGVRGDIRYVSDCAVAYLKYASEGTYRIAELYLSDGKFRYALSGKSGSPQFCERPAR